MIVSKWLVDEKLAQNSSLHFELISTILESMHCEFRMKILIKIEVFHFKSQVTFFYWSIGFMIKMLI